MVSLLGDDRTRGVFGAILLLAAGALVACEDLISEPFDYGKVEVTATRRSGVPVSGVRLTLYTGTRHLGYGTTDDNGRFSFQFVPTGRIGVLADPPVEFRPLDLDRGYSRVQNISEGESASAEFTYLKFGKGSVAVRAVDQSGDAVAGLPLQLYQPTGVVAEAVTGADGTFLFGDVPFGIYGVFAFPAEPYSFADGSFPGIADDLLIDEGHREDVQFTLERCSGRIRAVAVDQEGRSVEGAALLLYTWQGVVAEGSTDAQGTHRFTAIDCGDYGILITPPPGYSVDEGRGANYFDGLQVEEGEDVLVTFELRALEAPR